MSKDITPLKRYQHHIAEFRGYMGRFFTETSLNKSEPKRSWHGGDYHENAGVENDLVIIFKAPYNNLSVAFSLNFKDLPFEKQTIQASIKKGVSNDSIESSVIMNLDEFKVRLQSFNKWAKDNLEEEINFKTAPLKAVTHFAEVFLDKKMDIKKEIEDRQKALDDFITEKSKDLKLPSLVKKQTEAATQYTDAQKKIQSSLEEMSEYQEMVQLKSRVAELEKTIKAQEKSLETKLNLKGLKRNAEDSDHLVHHAQYNLEQAIAKHIKGTPKSIADKLNRQFKHK